MKAVAEALGVSISSLYAWRRTGGVRHLVANHQAGSEAFLRVWRETTRDQEIGR